MPAPPTQPSGRPVRVLLVEDHDMVAEAIEVVLNQAPDMEIIGRSHSIATALEEIRRSRPDVVVLDRRLPDGDGITAIAQFEDAAPQVRILVLTGEASPSVAASVARAGGAGLVLKSSGIDELETAVRRVAAGEAVFDSNMLAGVLDQLTGRGGGSGATLTGRERQTLQLMADGVSTEDIAERLGVARNTVRNHAQRVLEKLGARSKLEAVASARREGLLD